MAALDEFFKRLQQLREYDSVQEVLADPFARMLAAGVLSVVMLLLVFLQPYPEDEKKGAQKREPRGYTRAEVARHKAEDDLWIIIRHKDTNKLQVYDVTTYVEHHPGGDAIFAHAGGDCTEGFRGPQHPPTVWDLVAEYCIGWVEEE